MATEVIMPQMGESIVEGTITRWLVKVGDGVEKDQPLFEVSTDKVDAEIPSPAAGVLLEVRVEEGATVGVDEVVALIGEAGERVTAEGSEAVAEGPAQGGELESAVSAAEVPPAGEPAGAATGAVSEVEKPIEPVVERIRRFSSPLVRKIAQQEGVDLSQLEGTGLHGRVTKADILAHLGRRESKSSPAVRAPEVMPSLRSDSEGFFIPAFTEGENVSIEPMSRIRQITAAHMAYSKATSAHVSTVFHMDLARVAKIRQRAKEGFFESHGTKLTFMPFIFKAVASALKAHPTLNASVDGTSIVFKRDINIGMAVALDWGLIVPVIRHADQLNLIGLARAANDLADRARGKKLSPDEVQGGTFTVTNPGVFGSLFGTPIINQPQVAILGIGGIEKRPVVIDDAIAIRPMLYMAMSYDHRIVDGAVADQFLALVKHALENFDESLL